MANRVLTDLIHSNSIIEVCSKRYPEYKGKIFLDSEHDELTIEAYKGENDEPITTISIPIREITSYESIIHSLRGTTGEHGYENSVHNIEAGSAYSDSDFAMVLDTIVKNIVDAKDKQQGGNIVTVVDNKGPAVETQQSYNLKRIPQRYLYCTILLLLIGIIVLAVT